MSSLFGTIYHQCAEMVNVVNNAKQRNMGTLSTVNPRKDWVYCKLEELREAVQMDSFNLTRDEQDIIDIKIQELRQFLDQKYAGK